MSMPVDLDRSRRGARSATWRTGRPSETSIGSPCEHRVHAGAQPGRLGEPTSRSSASPVTAPPGVGRGAPRRPSALSLCCLSRVDRENRSARERARSFGRRARSVLPNAGSPSSLVAAGYSHRRLRGAGERRALGGDRLDWFPSRTSRRRRRPCSGARRRAHRRRCRLPERGPALCRPRRRRRHRRAGPRRGRRTAGVWSRASC